MYWTWKFFTHQVDLSWKTWTFILFWSREFSRNISKDGKDKETWVGGHSHKKSFAISFLTVLSGFVISSLTISSSRKSRIYSLLQSSFLNSTKVGSLQVLSGFIISSLTKFFLLLLHLWVITVLDCLVPNPWCSSMSKLMNLSLVGVMKWWGWKWIIYIFLINDWDVVICMKCLKKMNGTMCRLHMWVW